MEYLYVEVFNTSLLSDKIIQILTTKERRTLACVCKLLKAVLYNPKWWVTVNLPFPGSPSLFVLSRPTLQFHVLSQGSPNIGLYSCLRPPEDPLALENLLQALLPSKDRFTNTIFVQFKNYMFSDESIRLATKVFPSLERLFLDGGRITIEGMKYLKDFRKLRFLYVNCKNGSQWEAEDWLPPLESCLECLAMDSLNSSSKFLFLKKCTNCRDFFNPKFNSNKSCLYHPGTLIGYFPWSNYRCCWANDHQGCTYDKHREEDDGNRRTSRKSTQECIPEYYGIPYVKGLAVEQGKPMKRRDAASID